MLLLRNPTLLRLFLAQALFWSCAMIGITLTSLVGLQLAPLNGLATLPLALLVLALLGLNLVAWLAYLLFGLAALETAYQFLFELGVEIEAGGEVLVDAATGGEIEHDVMVNQVGWLAPQSQIGR